MEDIIEAACNPCRPWSRAGGINQVMVADRHKGHGDHGDHGHRDYSLTHDSLLRENEACFRAVGAEFVNVNNRIADAATAAALAASNTDKLILMSQTLATSLAAQGRDQAAANFSATQVQIERSRADVLLATEKSRADVLLATEKCCCDTQVVVRAEGEKTRDQTSTFKIRDLERAVDRKNCCYGGYDHRGPTVAAQFG